MGVPGAAPLSGDLGTGHSRPPERAAVRRLSDPGKVELRQTCQHHRGPRILLKCGGHIQGLLR